MIISPDAGNQIDGSVAKNILAHLPELPIGLVPISYFPNFVFKQPVVDKWILVDFMEPHTPNVQYGKFLEWIKENPPLLTFRRELLKRDISPVVKPIEWPCHLDIPPLSKREDFDSRRVSVLNVWGYSNIQRPKLHAAIFNDGMTKHGLNVISEQDQWSKRPMAGQYWSTIYAPFWNRLPMPLLRDFMRLSKITVAMPGNGKKTFRHTECVGTLMALQRDDLAWAFPWDETNSIQLTPGDEFNSLLEATRRTDLYDLYCACDSNMRKYEAKTYVKDYVLPAIQSVS